MTGRWREDQHPRDRRGRFSERGGGGWVAQVADRFAPAGHTPPARYAAIDRVQVGEMARWRRGARQPGRNVTVEHAITRRQELVGEQQVRVDAAQAVLERETRLARRRAQRQDPGNRAYQDDYVQYSTRVRNARGQLQLEQGALERYRTMPGLDHPIAQPRVTRTMAQAYDPSNPLAVYGDMLHIGGGEATHNSLRVFEQGYPPEWHALLADHFAHGENGGVWIGSGAVCYMDDAQDLINQQPRGWDPGDTFQLVNGCYRGNTRQILNGDTANARNREGGTAVLHEGGHALDHALGDVSRNRDWRRLTRRAIAEDDAYHPYAHWTSPYFRQLGDAGPSEYWAEAISVWRYSAINNGDNRTAHINALVVKFGMGHQTASDMLDYMEQQVNKQIEARRKAWTPTATGQPLSSPAGRSTRRRRP